MRVVTATHDIKVHPGFPFIMKSIILSIKIKDKQVGRWALRNVRFDINVKRAYEVDLVIVK